MDSSAIRQASVSGVLERALPWLRFALAWPLLAGVSSSLADGPRRDYPNHWSPTDVAFKEAMSDDLSFGVGKGRTQAGSIAAWEGFLSKENVAPEQRVFATWRIASMCAYNFDPRRGEGPDMVKAERLLRSARDMLPQAISLETVNAATLHASLPGTPIEKARRKAENYLWFRTRTDKMVADSAARTSPRGRIVAAAFYTQLLEGESLPPAEDSSAESIARRANALRSVLSKGEDCVVQQIADFIASSRDEWAIEALLKAVRGVADPVDLRRWRYAKTESRADWDTDRTIRSDDFLTGTTMPASPTAALVTSSPAKGAEDPPDAPAHSSIPRSGEPMSLMWLVVAVGAVLLVVAAGLVLRIRTRRGGG